MRRTDISWEAAFRQSPVALAILDRAGRHQVCNDRYAALLGYADGELHGIGVEGITWPTEPHLRHFELERLLDGRIESIDGDVVFVRKDASEVVLHVSARALRTDDEQTTRLLLSLSPADRNAEVLAATTHDDRLADAPSPAPTAERLAEPGLTSDTFTADGDADGAADVDAEILLADTPLRVPVGPAAVEHSPTDAVAPIAQLPAEGTTDDGSPGENPAYRVLVVEDNPVNQQLVANQLRQLGHDPVVVGSGEEALATFDDRPGIDVVLMDLVLPAMSGIDTTIKLRDRAAEMPVVGLTASTSPIDREACLAAGFDDFLVKPASLEKLYIALDNVLHLGDQPRVDDTDAEGIDDRDGSGVDDGPPSPELLDEQADPVIDRADAIDAGTLNRLAGELGDIDIVIDLVHTFLGELDDRSTAIRDAISASDLEAAGRAAHTLKSGARLLGADALADRCQQIEIGNGGDPDEIADLAADARAGLEQWLDLRVPSAT